MNIIRVYHWLPGILLAASWLSTAGGATVEPAAYTPVAARAENGAWQITGERYSAAVNNDGYLASFKVGTVETLGAPFAFQPDAKLVADSAKMTDDTLSVHLRGPGGEATIDYRFRRDGLTIVPTWRGSGFARFQLTASASLLGTELLNDKSVTTGGDSTHFAEQGEIRGVPAVASARNQMVRLHFPGFGLHAYVQTWGAPFNYESAGSVQGQTWGRPLLATGKPFPIVLTIQPAAGPAVLPAVVFVPRTDRVASLYYVEEPCTWTLDLGAGKDVAYLTAAGIRELNVDWQVTDFHDRQVANGKEMVRLDADAPKLTQPVTLKIPGSGYYQARFTLSDPSGRMLASSFQTRFTVIHQVPGMINRDDTLAGKNYSDYAVVGMIGIGGIRESHNIGGFFSNQAQKAPDWVPVEGAEPAVWMNVKSLDQLFTTAAAESAKYRLTWFFQANSRPAYATPPVYEAMAFALVSRFKDRCRVWEVENEPNFGYTPENYLNQCVIPFAKGAKRADPGCVIMGPGGCGVRDTLVFMEKIYALDGGKWFDNISTHSYPGPGEPWERFGNLSMLAELRAWMKTHGDDAKPLWQTEQGYSWDGAPKGPTARFATRQFLQAWRLGIEPQRHYYFYPQAHGFESWYQSGGGEAGSEHSWLPIAAAQRFLAENTVGRKYAGDIASPYKGIYLARFNGEPDDVIAAWTFDFVTTLQVRIPQLKSAIGFMGNPFDLKPGAAGAVALPLSGEPVYIHVAKGSEFAVVSPDFGTNFAAAAAGATASASSSAPANPPANAIDGNWELWEKAPGLEARTNWVSAQKDPTPQTPDILEVTFPCPRIVNRLLALCYLPAVNPAPRDFRFEAQVKGRWQVVGEGKDEWNWILHREFAPVTATAVRLVVTGINDGWHGDRRWMYVLMGPQAKNYTSSQVLVSELEAYGPGAQQRLALRMSGDGEAPQPGTPRVITVAAAKLDARTGILQVRIQAPVGWKADPDTLAFDLATGGAGGEIPKTFALSAPAERTPGPVPVRVLLEDSKGTVMDAAQVTLHVTSPFQVQPQTPESSPAGTRFALKVANVSAAELSGTARCALRRRDAAAGVAPVFQRDVAFGPVAPGQGVPVEFVADGVALAGTPWALTLAVTANGIREVVEQSLDIRGWQLLGPYPNEGGAGFDTAYEPETTRDLARAYVIPGVKEPVKWKTAMNEPSGFVDLLHAFTPNANVCAYAWIRVSSPTARQARLAVGSDDGIKAWVNGEVVVKDNAQRGAAPGQDEAPVNLRVGSNEILLKITQGGGGWGFYCDLLTPDGKPMPDLVYEAAKAAP